MKLFRTFFHLLWVVVALTTNFSRPAIAQDSATAQELDAYWAHKDSLYPLTDIRPMLAAERYYADSCEQTNQPQTWSRQSNYSFLATYLGKSRRIDRKIDSAMRRCYKIMIGDPIVLDTLVDSEALFQVGTEKIWMPIQKKILVSLQEEAHKGDPVMLYCCYFNWHNMRKELYTIFLVCEFQVWDEDDGD